MRSRGIRQRERLGRIRPSIPSSTQLKDTAKTGSQSSLDGRTGKEDAPRRNSLKNITRNAVQYGNLNTKHIRQGDS